MSAANLSDSEQQTLRDATKILKRMWEQGESSRKQIYDYLPFNLAILIGASAVSRTRPAELPQGCAAYRAQLSMVRTSVLGS